MKNTGKKNFVEKQQFFFLCKIFFGEKCFFYLKNFSNENIFTY